MTEPTAAEIVNQWFKLVGATANEPCYLNVEPGRVYVSGADGTVVTAATDWDLDLDAETMEGLAELMQGDIDEFEACDEDEL